MRLHSDDIDMMRTGAGALSAALVLAVAAAAQPAHAQGWNPPPPEKRCPRNGAPVTSAARRTCRRPRRC